MDVERGEYVDGRFAGVRVAGACRRNVRLPDPMCGSASERGWHVYYSVSQRIRAMKDTHRNTEADRSSGRARVLSSFRIAFILLGLIIVPPINESNGDSGYHPNPAAVASQSYCATGDDLGSIDVSVRFAARSLPAQTMLRLTEGDIVRYAPHGRDKRRGEVALILIPEKSESDQQNVLLTDSARASEVQEWVMPRTIAVAALIYGPAGLNRSRIARLLSREQTLVAQIADLASKTVTAEQAMRTLSQRELSEEGLLAVLQTFAAQSGVPVQLDTRAPVSVQIRTILTAMSPHLSQYNATRANSPAQRLGPAASVAAAIASLFFGNTVGVAAAGVQAFVGLRSAASPDTVLRPVFAQPLSGSVVRLCGQALIQDVRPAFIWAIRIPNLRPPALKLAATDDYVPLGQKTTVKLSGTDTDWKYLHRAREWTLVGSEEPTIPVAVTVLADGLEIDLTKLDVQQGDYKLSAMWDWTPLRVRGTLHVVGVSDFKGSRLTAESQERLTTKAGKVPVTICGGDFQFTTGVSLVRQSDPFATDTNIRFRLPRGFRRGPQECIDAQIDTTAVDAGPYSLAITQAGAPTQQIPVKVLPQIPEIKGLPITIRPGEKQRVVLTGERLDLITSLQSPAALMNIEATSGSTERRVTIEPLRNVTPGSTYSLIATMRDRAPMRLIDGLRVAQPRPVISVAHVTTADDSSVELEPDEFAAGHIMNALITIRAAQSSRWSVLRLNCGESEPIALRVGQRSDRYSLHGVSDDQIFLTIDTELFPAACSLQAVLDGDSTDGPSQPVVVSRLIRVPQIESMSLPPSENGTVRYRLIGRNLELIRAIGWSSREGVASQGLPIPIGPGLRQFVDVVMPSPPATDAFVYVWLPGDQHGRRLRRPPVGDIGNISVQSRGDGS